MSLLGMIGLPEIVVILLVVLLIFGPSKLPQLGEGIGKMLRGFKKEMKALDEDRSADADISAKAKAPAEPEEPGEIDVTPRETETKKKVG